MTEPSHSNASLQPGTRPRLGQRPRPTPASAVKRLADVVLSLIGLIVLSPILAVAALAVRISMGAPVLFRQTRPGYKGVPFVLCKLRTMRNALGPDGNPLPDKDRLTHAGQIIRKTSLDEIPQLWNVLKGEMSLIGPRPLLMRYLPLYSPEQMRRHDMRPGITGWAQVMGRNTLSWDEKFEYDVWYVDNWSLLLDLRTLFLTVRTVVNRSGVSQAGEATMSEFTGYK